MPVQAEIVAGLLPSAAAVTARAEDVTHSLSPSLLKVAGRGRAFEMKFLLDRLQTANLESLLSPHLTLDPHADPALGNAYRTTTLYCDTFSCDVLRRIGSHARRKYRIRRYGHSSSIFLERKLKQGERVRKRRSMIDQAELRWLGGVLPENEWSGTWFAKQIMRRNLRPAMLIQYVRTAYFGTSAEGPVRVTFDRDIRGRTTSEWNVAPFDGGVTILPDHVVCEFKFHRALPTSLRQVIESLRLSPRGVSKYRQCAVAASDGLTGNASPVASASAPRL